MASEVKLPSEEDFQRLKELLLNDDEIRSSIIKYLCEKKGANISDQDPPGWVEDALQNVIDWLVERVKDLWNGIADWFKDFAEEAAKSKLDEIFADLDPGIMPSHEGAIRMAGKFLSLSFSTVLGHIFIAVLGQLFPGVNLTAVARLVDWWYWGLGFGFMGWQIIAPLTRMQMLNPLEEAYNIKYPTRRATWSRVVAMYRDGVISKKSAVEQLRKEGFTQEVIDELILQAEKARHEATRMERPAPWTRGIMAYRLGKIDREELTKILQLHRFDRDAIRIILATADRDRERELLFSPEFSVETQALRRRAELLREWVEEMKRYLKVEEVEQRIEEAKEILSKLQRRLGMKLDEYDLRFKELRALQETLYLPIMVEVRERLQSELRGLRVEYEKLRVERERLEAQQAELQLKLELAVLPEEREAREERLKALDVKFSELKAEEELLEYRIRSVEERLYAPLPPDEIRELQRREDTLLKGLKGLEEDIQALKSQITDQEERLERLQEMVKRYPELIDLEASLKSLEEKAALMMMNEVYALLEEHDLLVKGYLEDAGKTVEEFLERVEEPDLQTSLERYREMRDLIREERRIKPIELAPEPTEVKIETDVAALPITPEFMATIRGMMRPGIPYRRAVPYEVPLSIPELAQLARALIAAGIPIPPPVPPPPAAPPPPGVGSDVVINTITDYDAWNNQQLTVEGCDRRITVVITDMREIRDAAERAGQGDWRIGEWIACHPWGDGRMWRVVG